MFVLIYSLGEFSFKFKKKKVALLKIGLFFIYSNIEGERKWAKFLIHAFLFRKEKCNLNTRKDLFNLWKCF